MGLSVPLPKISVSRRVETGALSLFAGAECTKNILQGNSTHMQTQIGIRTNPNDRYASYYLEAIEHAGLPYFLMDDVHAESLQGVDVLVLCGDGHLTDSEQKDVEDWLKRNGSVVCSGGTWGIEHLLGVEVEQHLSVGRLQRPEHPESLWPEGTTLARFYGGSGCRPTKALMRVACESGHAGATQLQRAFFFAPHVGQTLAMMQLGRSVETDGIGPADSELRLDDGILRAEDGTTLNFDTDRTEGTGVSPAYFGEPHSDLVREVWVRIILAACIQTGSAPVLLWPWPENADGAATLSIECDTFDADHFRSLSRILLMYGALPAWLVALPGYSLDIYRSMLKMGHEIGLLFSAEDTSWTDDRLRVQQLALMRSTSQAAICTSRPKEGQWIGLSKFYELGAETGIRMSVSKGGRQPGTSGFLFGSCKPFYPSWRGGTHNRIMELPYACLEPGLISSNDCSQRTVEMARLTGGCAHAALRVDSVANPNGAAGLRHFLTLCHQARLTLMTPQMIHDYEQARRSVSIRTETWGSDKVLVLYSPLQIDQMTLLIGAPGIRPVFAGHHVKHSYVMRHGVEFCGISLDLAARQTIELQLVQEQESAA